MEQEQELLYTNLLLLNYDHPPSAEFKEIFKKTMLAKNNKVAFFQVFHYLASILNQKLCAEKFKSWPTGNIISRENNFRKEILQFLNEVNAIYKAELPTLLASHLIAPGGKRFIQFTYKFSQLVLLEELKKTYSDEILHKPKPSKDIQLNCKVSENIMIVTNGINAKNNEIIDDFVKKLKSSQKKADEIVDRMNSISAQFKIIQTNMSNEKDYQINDEELSKKFNELQQNSKIVEQIDRIHIECSKFMNHLRKVNGDNIDYTEAVKNLNDILKKQLLELKKFSLFELKDAAEDAKSKDIKLKFRSKQVNEEHYKLLEVMNNSRTTLAGLVENVPI